MLIVNRTIRITLNRYVKPKQEIVIKNKVRIHILSAFLLHRKVNILVIASASILCWSDTSLKRRAMILLRTMLQPARPRTI
jgi:hypothetical protein